MAHWRKARFADYVRRHRMGWPTYENGNLDERDETFREMAGKYPQIEPLRELRYSLSKLRLNDLAVGRDHRNRASLWAYGTKTARNAPGASQYVFGPAKWLRFLITPPPGRALVHRDYRQQEVRIAAVQSGDSALLQACESGDVYLGMHNHPPRRGHADLPGVPQATEQHCCSVQWRAAETWHQPLRQISGSGPAAQGRDDRDREGRRQALDAGDLALVPVAA